MLFAAEEGPVALHDEQAQQHQRRADIAPQRQDLAGHDKGHHGGKYRLQGKDQAHMAGGGILLLDRLNDEGNAGAYHAQKQRRRPGFAGGRQMDGFPQHQSQGQGHGAHHCQLAHMLRKRLHKIGIRSGFRAVFSPEPMREGAMILCEEQNKKSNVGTISYLPALFGIGCASVVVRDLLGEMEDSGKRESND